MKLIELLVLKEVVKKRVYYTILNEVGMIPCFLYLNYLPSIKIIDIFGSKRQSWGKFILHACLRHSMVKVFGADPISKLLLTINSPNLLRWCIWDT